MARKKKGEMKKRSVVDIVKWLESDKGQKTMQKSIEDAKERTSEMRSSMRVERERLLTPVTL